MTKQLPACWRLGPTGSHVTAKLSWEREPELYVAKWWKWEITLGGLLRSLNGGPSNFLNGCKSRCWAWIFIFRPG